MTQIRGGRATFLPPYFFAIACCAIMVSACNTPRSSTVVIYDQEWSRAAGIANLVCAPPMREACREEALSDEVGFSKTLVSAFDTTPACRGIQFVVDTGVSGSSQDKAGHVLNLRKGPHWRLRVDYHPRLSAHSFKLDLVSIGSKDYSRVGGEGTTITIASFACEMSKKNGVVDYW